MFNIGDRVRVVSWPEKDREEAILGYLERILFEANEIEKVVDDDANEYMISVIVKAASIEDAVVAFKANRNPDIFAIVKMVD